MTSPVFPSLLGLVGVVGVAEEVLEEEGKAKEVRLKMGSAASTSEPRCCLYQGRLLPLPLPLRPLPGGHLQGSCGKLGPFR